MIFSCHIENMRLRVIYTTLTHSEETDDDGKKDNTEELESMWVNIDFLYFLHRSNDTWKLRDIWKMNDISNT